MKILDLSMRISSAMPVFPGDPEVRIDVSRGFPDHAYQVSTLCLGSHTGTHADAPRHFLPDGADISEIGLQSFTGEAICLRPGLAESEGRTVIDLSEKQKRQILTDDRIIFSTGWERKAGTPDYFSGFPVFSDGLIDFLLEKRPLLIGADLPTLSGPGDPFQMHRVFFKQRAVFIEGLIRTGELPEGRFYFSAAPLQIENGDGSPVRAYAIVDG